MKEAKIREIQEAQKKWAEHNFPKAETWQPLLGVVEEVGELAHAHLKQSQGIRVNEDHVANAMDAVGDTVLFMMHYCTLRGWDFETIIQETWEQVAERDWRKNNETGKEESPPPAGHLCDSCAASDECSYKSSYTPVCGIYVQGTEEE